MATNLNCTTNLVTEFTLINVEDNYKLSIQLENYFEQTIYSTEVVAPCFFQVRPFLSNLLRNNRKH